MRTVVVSFPDSLPRVGRDPQPLPTRGGGLELTVDHDARVRVGDGAAGPLVDVEVGRHGRVRIHAHRETASMDPRDYGGEVSRMLPDLVEGVRDVRGDYGLLGGTGSPVVTGLAGRDAVEARCVCHDVVRVIVVATHRAGDAASADAVARVVDGIRLV